nr:helix-turn-helix transcriptional regulator [Kribbella italica]
MRQRRDALGISQKVLARKVSLERGWTEQATIARIETGKRGVSLADAIALAQALSCELGDLLTPVKCQACKDNPPAGYSCQTCGTSSERSTA